MSQRNEPNSPEDIPAWLLSLNRRLLRLCHKPGFYTLTIEVAHTPSKTWTYSISEQLYFIRNVKIRLDEED